MAHSYLVLDIETVPDPALYVPPDTRMGEERPFPPLYVHKPIVLGCLLFDESYNVQRFGVIGETAPKGNGASGPVDDERLMLEDFARFVDRKLVHLVTFNGRGFDLPVIALRCLRHGIPLRWYYQSRNYRYRYTDEGHLDLCDFLSEHGAAKSLSLDAAARVIGLPGKVGIDGSRVEGLYQAGQLEQIRTYCLHDVVQTAFLFLRFRLLQGIFDLMTYRRAASGLLERLTADGRFGKLVESSLLDRLLLTERVAPTTPGMQPPIVQEAASTPVEEEPLVPLPTEPPLTYPPPEQAPE